MALELQALPLIHFGFGCAEEAGSVLARDASVVALVRGSSEARSAAARRGLEKAGVTVVPIVIDREPRIADVVAGVEMVRERGCGALLACGGGSVLDAAKAIAGLSTNPGDPLDYLEVVGRGMPLRAAPLPWHAMPTTAGTGAEVTRNAVLAVPDRRVKVSLRSPLLLARSVWLDPDLLLGLPPAVRAATGLDALTQLIEAYVCTKASPQSDVWCEAGLPRVAAALPQWVAGDDSPAVREAMAWGALWSGAALAQAGLGAVHGLAGPLGGYCEAPHGAVCGALLAPVLQVNLAALPGADPRRARFARVAAWLTGNPDAAPEACSEWVAQQSRAFALPSLRHWGVTQADLPLVARQGLQASSMKANPIALTADTLEAVLRAAW